MSDRAVYSPHMVALADIQSLADRIARLFQPERIILFGSHAYGQPRESSDVDLLLIMEHEGSALDMDVRIWSATRPPFSADFIIRRPADTARRYREFDPLIREAVDKGKVLYDRRSS